MTPDELAARLERIEAVLTRFERFLTVAVDAAPFWLRAKIKGAMNDDQAGRPDNPARVA